MAALTDQHLLCYNCDKPLEGKQLQNIKMLLAVGGIGSKGYAAYCPECWPGATKAKKKVFYKKQINQG